MKHILQVLSLSLLMLHPAGAGSFEPPVIRVASANVRNVWGACC